MKRKLDSKILNWFLAFGIIHFGCHFFHQYYLMKDTQQNQKETLFRNLHSEKQIWFMGDSHPMLAVNPGFIPDSYNWATRSENFLLTYFKIKFLLNQGFKPKHIYLGAELHSFSAQGKALILNHELDDGWWASKISPFEFKGNEYRIPFLRWWLTANFASHAGQFYHLKFLFPKPEMGFSDNGFFSDSTVWNPEKDSFGLLTKKFKSHFGKYDLVDPVQLEFLNKIVDLTQKEGIKLSLIKYPVSKPYLHLAYSKTKSNQIDSIYQGFSGKIEVLDYRTYFLNSPEFFSDPDHLNNAGAKIFSLMLKKQGN